MDPYRILDLPPDAPPAEVRQAHLRLKNLYAFGSSATYALLSDEERQEILDRLDQALEMIVCNNLPPEPAGQKEVFPSGIAGQPDPEETPGAFLRWTRQTRGLTLKDLAERTKIGAPRIEAIEQENEEQFLPPAYLRGAIYSIARELGIPSPRKFTELYLSKFPSLHGN